MRLLPALPLVLCIVALILSFLCIFAGSKPGFMEDYSIIALNTSRIGQNLLKTSPQSTNPFIGFLQNLTKPLTTAIQNDLNSAAASLARDLGLQDFYSAHVLDHCQGSFVPGPVPNNTVHKISRNITSCSNRTANFDFNPGATLQRALNSTGTGLTLADLGWPDEIDSGFKDLRTAVRVTFALYCIGIAFTFLAIFAFLFWMAGPSSDGRSIPLTGSGLASAASMALGIGSSVVTAVAVKGNNIIDKYGAKIGVEAERGNGYLAMTWAATACVALASLVGCFGCFVGRRRRAKVRHIGEK